jgi:hypothetical protein
LRFLFRGKLRFDLLGNGVGVHLVVLGGVFERLTSLRLRRITVSTRSLPS